MTKKSCGHGTQGQVNKGAPKRRNGKGKKEKKMRKKERKKERREKGINERGAIQAQAEAPEKKLGGGG